MCTFSANAVNAMNQNILPVIFALVYSDYLTEGSATCSWSDVLCKPCHDNFEVYEVEINMTLTRNYCSDSRAASAALDTSAIHCSQLSRASRATQDHTRSIMKVTRIMTPSHISPSVTKTQPHMTSESQATTSFAEAATFDQSLACTDSNLTNSRPAQSGRSKMPPIELSLLLWSTAIPVSSMSKPQTTCTAQNRHS